jgi:hypothetical protein
MMSRGLLCALILGSAGLATGCSPAAPPTPGPLDTAPAPPRSQPPSVSDAAPSPITEAPRADDADLRDPFQEPHAPGPPTTTPLRRTRRFSVADLKLIGVAGASGDAHALVRDPTGRGWVVAAGELVGRPETRGGAVASWRVDRIRERDVVLALDAGQGRPLATRVLALPADPLIEAHD